MKITYDPTFDMVTITFSDDGVMATSSGNPFAHDGGCVNTGVSESGRIVRIRIHSASKMLPSGVVEEITRTSTTT